MSTFIFNNQSEGSSYVVLDPEFKTNPVSSTVSKYFSSVSFSNLNNISEDDIVVNDYKLGIVVPEGNSSFEFTPSTPVPTSDVIIRGAGNCSVVYQDGATTINVTPSELNRRGEESPSFTNPFCFEFNGSGDSVQIAGSNNTLDLNGEISISSWITIDEDVFNTGSGEEDYHIVDKQLPAGNAASGYALFITRGSSNVKMKARFGVSNNILFNVTAQTNIQAGAANELAPNTTHNIVATFDPNAGTSGEIRMYFNGVLSVTKNIPVTGTYQPASTKKFIIGNASDITPGILKEYHGKIDEVSIWDTKLEQSDVTALYNWTTNGNLNNYSKSANLKGWYRMGENATFDTGTGNWTLKSATDVNDSTLYLTSTGIAQTDIKTPGLIGPA